MRRRTIISLVALVLLLLGLAWVRPLGERSGFHPQATLTVLRYDTTNRTSYTEVMPTRGRRTNAPPWLRFDTSPPSDGYSVRTNASVLLAQVRLSNTGTQPIGFESYGHVPEYGCQVLRDGVWADYTTGHYFTGGPAMLDVGKSVDFTVWLPPDVIAWRFEFESLSTGPRLRAAWRMYDRGWRGRLPELLLYALPLGRQRYAYLRSEVFTVAEGKLGAQTRDLHVVP